MKILAGLLAIYYAIMTLCIAFAGYEPGAIELITTYIVACLAFVGDSMNDEPWIELSFRGKK